MEPAASCHSPWRQGNPSPLIVYCDFARKSIPNSPGQWLVHVHSGHIVKVARVAPEMSADAVLDDSTSRAHPKSASCHVETR